MFVRRKDSMNKAIFLDRDGTINIEKNYLYKIEDFEFIPGAIEGMRELSSAGFKLIIITNQSGIARGYYTEDEFKILNDWMLEELRCQGVVIDAVYYCPHLPDASIDKYKKNCSCRKPSLGLYEKAISEYDIDLERSYAVGDKIRDCSICEKTNCQGYLIGNNEKNDIVVAVRNGKYKNIGYAEDLKSAAAKIVEEAKCI